MEIGFQIQMQLNGIMMAQGLIFARLIDVICRLVGHCSSRFHGVSNLATFKHDCLLSWTRRRRYVHFKWIVLGKPNDFDWI